MSRNASLPTKSHSLDLKQILTADRLKRVSEKNKLSVPNHHVPIRRFDETHDRKSINSNAENKAIENKHKKKKKALEVWLRYSDGKDWASKIKEENNRGCKKVKKQGVRNRKKIKNKK